MQINNVVKLQNIQHRQNFKGNSVSSSPFLNFSNYQQIPLEIHKSYVSPKVNKNYKALKIFNVPNVGQGTLYELSNGHKVAIIKNNDSISIKTFVKGGSEDAAITSHLLEHLIYRSDTNINGKEFSELTAELGAGTNAATHGSYTEYFMNYPFNNKDDIDKLIKIQSEMLQNPSFTEEQVEKEKKIISIEYKGKEIAKKLEEKNAMFIDTLLDVNNKADNSDFSKAAIDKVSINNVMDFYNKKYNNNKMVSVVVGDVNPDEVINSFSKYFNKKNTLNISEKQTEAKVVLQESKRIDLTNDLYFDSPVNIGFVGPKNNNLKDSFLATALGSYINELSKQQDNTRIKMSTVVSGNNPKDDLGLKFSIISFDENENKIDILNSYLKELTQKDFSDEEIKNIKEILKNSNSLITENSEKVASAIGESLINEKSGSYLDMYNYIAGLTSKDLQDFIKKYINPEKQLTMVFTKSQPSIDNKAVSFKGSSYINDINTENIKGYSLPNNLQLIVDAAPETTRTTFSLEFKHYDLPKDNIKTYIALEKMLQYKMNENNNSTKNKVNHIELQSDLDKFKVVVNALPENTIQSIESAKKTILNTNFSPNDLEKIKNEFKDTNDNIDEVKFFDVINLYYKIISSSTGKAVLTIPQGTFNGNQANIISSINIDIPLLQAKSEKGTQLKSNFNTLNKTNVIIEKNHGDNSAIYQSFKFNNGGQINYEDVLALSLLSQILGDGNNSRLHKDIRENQSLVYKATSNFRAKDNNSYFEIFAEAPITSSNSADLQKILNSYKYQINKLTTSPVSEEELNQAKMLLKSEYMSRFEESSNSRNELLSLYSVKELSDLFKTIDTITTQDIQNTANKYLNSSSTILIKTNQEVLDANRSYIANI